MKEFLRVKIVSVHTHIQMVCDIGRRFVPHKYSKDIHSLFFHFAGEPTADL